MSLWRPELLDRHERELERNADALLRSVPRDADRPAYSEVYLARRSRLESALDAAADTPAPASRTLGDEVGFLLSLSRVGADTRRCLALWIAGWSQEEIADAWGISQQRVSQRIRVGLAVCYDAEPVSFAAFCRHAVYRPPRRYERTIGLARCCQCGVRIDTTRVRGRRCFECRSAATTQRTARRRAA